jgi:hypothetical protein
MSFEKVLKGTKRKKRIVTGLGDFEKFYEQLFSHEGLDETEDLINI